MLQPTLPLLSSPAAPAGLFFVPVGFALPRHGVQEPKTATDTPSGAAPPTGANPQVPGPGPQPAPAGPCGADNNMFLFLGLGLALMYFLVMRPENKRRKEQQAMLAAVKVGDRVVTLGGMHGVVAGLSEKTLTLRVDTVKITIDRTAVARVDRGEGTGTEAKSG